MGRPAEAIARATIAFALFKRGNAGCQAGVGREDQILDARDVRPAGRLCFLCAEGAVES
jgi:hypothetical protein